MKSEIRSMYMDARRLHDKGRLAAAGKLYQEILNRNPAHADSLHMLGVLAYQTNRQELAIRLIDQAIEIRSDEPSFHNNQGNAFQALGRFSDAEACHRRALASDGRNADVLYNLGSALQGQGRFREAVVQYETALAQRPEFPEAYFSLATALHQLGELAAAVKRYKQAIKINPSYAEAHNGLGYALQFLGQSECAISCYRAAINFDSDFVEAFFNLATVYQDKDQLVEAEKYYRRVLELNPNHAAAHNNLGYISFRRGKLNDAISKYRLSIELDDEYADAYNNLGYVLQAQGKLAEAKCSYEKAVRIDPNHAVAYNNLGNVLKGQGLFSEASQRYGQAIASDPDYVLPYYNRVELKTYGSSDAELAELENLVSKVGQHSPDTAMYVHFALGKALDDVQCFDRAFKHLSIGNELARRQIKYDEKETKRYFDKIKSAFDRQLFTRLSGAGHHSSRPVFIVGMPRSGTTLIEQVLASHSRIHAAGEWLEFDATIRKCFANRNYPDCINRVTPSDLMDIASDYLNCLPKLPKDQIRVTDKLPRNFLNLGLIFLALPNARIIHAVRDPLDTCLSCFSKLFTELTQEFSYDLIELARYYGWYQGLMRHWHQVLPVDTILDVSYEALVDDLEQQVRRMLNFLDLKWDDRCLRFYETHRPVETASAAQVRQPLYRKSVERWRNYELHIAPLAELLRQV